MLVNLAQFIAVAASSAIILSVSNFVVGVNALPMQTVDIAELEAASMPRWPEY